MQMFYNGWKDKILSGVLLLSAN